MIETYIAEALGSFVFFVVILTKTDPVMIAVGFLVGILIASIGSQGHLNPAVTTMAYTNGKISGNEAIGYICAQLIAAMLAVLWSYYYFHNQTSTQPITQKII